MGGRRRNERRVLRYFSLAAVLVACTHHCGTGAYFQRIDAKASIICLGFVLLQVVVALWPSPSALDPLKQLGEFDAIRTAAMCQIASSVLRTGLFGQPRFPKTLNQQLCV